MLVHACCPDCAASPTLGNATLFAIDDPSRQLTAQAAPVDPAAQQRESFDDLMSLLSLLSIALNLSRGLTMHVHRTLGDPPGGQGNLLYTGSESGGLPQVIIGEPTILYETPAAGDLSVPFGPTVGDAARWALAAAVAWILIKG